MCIKKWLKKRRERREGKEDIDLEDIDIEVTVEKMLEKIKRLENLHSGIDEDNFINDHYAPKSKIRTSLRKIDEALWGIK